MPVRVDQAPIPEAHPSASSSNGTHRVALLSNKSILTPVDTR